MYLLDTDTLIYILKGNPIVERNLRGHYHDPIKISGITLMELYYGAYKSQKTISNLAKIKTLENTLEIIPLGREIVEIFGIQKANLEKAGNPYYDTALSYHPSSLRCTIDLAGVDHVLFGTDAPYTIYDFRAEETIEKIENSGFSKEEKEKIFFKNSIKLFPRLKEKLQRKTI